MGIDEPRDSSGLFGPYQLFERLGRGGMGEVWRARHVAQDRVVALKLLRDELSNDSEFEARFLREARLTAKLNAPHIVPVHDWGRIDGQLYLDMRLIDGEDLRDRLDREGSYRPAHAVSIIAQVASALDAAHRADLVHRDVKPSNILLCSDQVGGPDFVYLVDFGIARAISGTALTQAGSAVGSADYMAPERLLEMPVDGRADVYALGCVLYECLTGQTPFPSEEIGPLIAAHLRTAPPRPSRLAPDAALLDAVVARALAKDPRERFATAGAFAAAARAAFTIPPALPRPAAEIPCFRSGPPPPPPRRPLPATWRAGPSASTRPPPDPRSMTTNVPAARLRKPDTRSRPLSAIPSMPTVRQHTDGQITVRQSSDTDVTVTPSASDEIGYRRPGPRAAEPSRPMWAWALVAALAVLVVVLIVLVTA